MSDNNKIDPEKLKQLQQLMAMHAAGKDGMAAGGTMPQQKKSSRFTPKGMFIAMLQGMQSSVKFIDQFTNFIVNKKTTDSNTVVDSARSPIIFGTYITIIFVFCGTIWASLAPLDSATVAIGTVISNTQRKSLNHQEGGIIKNIFVKVGDKVQKGDQLLEFDSTKIRSDYESILGQYRAYAATEARLLAEINRQDSVDYPEFLIKDKSVPEVTKIIETQNNLFNSKKDLKRAEQDSLGQKIKQYKKQIEGYEARKISYKKTLEGTQDRLEATKKLNAQGYAQKAVLLDFESKEAELQSRIAETDTEIARSEQEITRTEIELLNVESKLATDSLNQLREAQGGSAQARERFYALSDQLDRVFLKSPVDGIVNNINYHTVGSVIPGGQTIMEVSPSDDHLIIEAKVLPQNIDSIHVGLKSRIRFSAFKSRTTPMFTGVVVSLSPDIVIDQRQGDPKLANGYYLARIEINMDEFNEVARTRKIELHPGMGAEVQIITGTRTLMRYLLDPVVDSMFKGFKEK